MAEPWKSALLAALLHRNAVQSNGFRPLIQQQDILRKSQAALLEHRRALESEVAQLKQMNLVLREKSDARGHHRSSPGGSGGGGGQGTADQEARIQQLQEDLTASYKRNSENAQAMLELSAQIQEVQASLAKREDDIVQLKSDLDRSQDHCAKYKNALKDLQVTKRVLQEELQALQVEYVKMEEQHTKLGVDYNELLDRWMKKANSDADKVNVANEFYNNMLKMQRNTELLQQAGGDPAAHAPSSAAARQYSALAERVPATPRKTVSAHRGEINTCTYNGAGTAVATGSGDKTVRLWDCSTGANRLTLSGAGQAVMCVRFSASGEFILGASNDNASRLWSTKTGRVRHTFTGHIGKVYSAAFSSDSKKIVTGSHDRTLKVWDLTKGYCMRTIFCFSSCNDLCLTTDGARIVSGHLDGNVRFWDAAQGECSHVLSGVHTKQVTSVSLSADGNFLLSASRDNTLKVVDMRTYEVLHSLEDELYRSGINWSRACFSPKGNYAAAGSADGSVVVWNVQKGTTEKVLEGSHQRTVSCVAWSPTGEQLCSCDRNGNVVFWGV